MSGSDNRAPPPPPLQNFSTRDLPPTLWEKCKKEPWVPAGLLVTVGCLAMGIRSMKLKEAHSSQLWMRARVVAQFGTVAGLLIGTGMGVRDPKKQSKIFDDEQAPTPRQYASPSPSSSSS